MEEEKKVTTDKKIRTNKNRRIKMNNQMKKKAIILTTATTMLILIIAIIIGVVSRITNQTSTNVGKQNNDISQNDENNTQIGNPEEKDKPEEQENNKPEEGKNPTEEQPQQPNQTAETTEPQEKKTGKEKYYIKVNNQANVVTIYKKDADGYYTIPCKAMVCSIGTATPESGVYKTSDKYTWRKLFGHTEGTYVYGQYATRIVKSILFHSVPYQNPNDPSSLEYWEYDKLGTKASAGCIRLTVQDAKWIYDNCAKGTQVEFYSSADPGPLGKPTAQKISNEASYVRGWDPTDPSGSNPWKTYTGNQQHEQQPTIIDNGNTNQSNNNLNGNNNTTENENPTNSSGGGSEIVQQPDQTTIPSGGNGENELPENKEDDIITTPTTTSE
jgi:lipoprotein-anchoring transpeptidase ErfK/SrfK